jgi:hypothetical protein
MNKVDKNINILEVISANLQVPISRFLVGNNLKAILLKVCGYDLNS